MKIWSKLKCLWSGHQWKINWMSGGDYPDTDDGPKDYIYICSRCGKIC